MKINYETLIFTALLGIFNSPLFGQHIKNNSDMAYVTRQTQKNINEFKTDSTERYRKYILEANLRISENDKSIVELKSRKLTGKKEEIKLFVEKVLILEKINNELKTRLDEAVTMKPNIWPTYITEFDRDMADLERSIKKLLVDPIDKTAKPINP